MKTKDRALFRKSLDYYVIIGVFIAGAIIGGVLTKITGYMSVGFACIPIMAAVFIMRKSGCDEN